MSSVSRAHAQLLPPGGCASDKLRGSCRQVSSGCRNCSSQSSGRRSAHVSDEWRRAVQHGKSSYGLHHCGEKVGKRLLGAEAECSKGLGSLWMKDIALILLPERKRYRFFTRFDRKYGKGAPYWGLGKWRGESCEATEERRSLDFEPVNVPANFVRNPSNQNCQDGRSTQEVRGQRHEDLTVSLTGPAEPLEQEGARVKVIGAGVGASVILNFCQQSSLLPSADFWYSSDSASEPVLLSEHVGGSYLALGGSEVERKEPLTTQDDNVEMVFLVLGASSGTGLGGLPRQLQAVRSKGSLAVGIFIQPFMFEGSKRQEQANRLTDGLLECTDMLLVVEQDGLLRRDVVTVSEASSIAKNAVLLSIKAISDLLLGNVGLSLDTVESSIVTYGDTRKMLQHAGRSWLGCGRGQNFKEAIEMAVAEAPVSDYRAFGAHHLVLCILATALCESREDVVATESILRQTLGPEIQLVVRSMENPMLEDGVKLSTIIITSCDFRPYTQQVTSSQSSDTIDNEYGTPSIIGITPADNDFGSQQNVYNSGVASESSSFCSYGSSYEQASSTGSGASIGPPGVVSNRPQSVVDDNSSSTNKEKSISGTQNSSAQKPKWQPQARSLGKSSSVHSYRSSNREDIKSLDARQGSPRASIASSASQKSVLALGWEAGPSSDVAEAWARARAQARERTLVTSDLDVSLPVGVREDAQQYLRSPKENVAFSTGVEVAEDKWIGTKAVPVDPDALPRNRMMDLGLEAVWDMYNAASALVMGKEMTDNTKLASLSQRAASMLESERSQKKLTPLVEMGFKNGSYKGRCKGGLPEGKGRLSFPDGSFYDGQWKQGRRAGAGAFYYINGDMFQGSWKDDVMHGKVTLCSKLVQGPLDELEMTVVLGLPINGSEKSDIMGWMYYHNGDRLYANFWKGKADGEGRFYSLQGDVFFGQFHENWRHGDFLYIEASGVRWTEVWENGILKSRTPTDS